MQNSTDFIKFPTLKGSQDIIGIWFPAQWFNNEQRRSLLIKNWFMGCKIYQFVQGDLLKFPSAQKQYCDSLDGWPLIYQAGVLCSSEIPLSLWQKMPVCDLILIIGNTITTYCLEDALELDPAQWVDLDGYQLLETKSYAVNIVYNEVIDFTEKSKSIEQIFDGKIPTPSPEMLKYIEQHQQQLKQQHSPNQSTNITKQGQASKKNYTILWIALASILFGLYHGFVNKNPKISSATQVASSETSTNLVPYLIFGIIILFFYLKSINFFGKISAHFKASKQDKIVIKNFAYNIKQDHETSNNNKSQINLDYDVYNSDSQLNYGANGSDTNLPARSKPKETKSSRWRNYMTIFTIFTKLSHLIAFRQGDYIKKMMKKFADGDLEEALRYALPINNDNSQGQSFGLPKPRNKLSLSERVYGSSSSVYLEPEFLDHLQTLYRQSFEKLAKQDKVEQAVFVLVELLNSLNEAIEFLEQRKLYKQAMELAIARDAEPELIVKLCCLANNWDMAIMIARRDNIFANAILMLEKNKPELANKLRLEWAKTLAEKAEWLAAIDAIWPLTEYRYLAEQWFNNTDKLSGKALVKRFILLPDSIDKLEDCLTALKNNPNYYQKRLDIAKEILNQQKDIEKLQGLLRLFINIIIADVITYPNAFSISDIAKLIELTQDKSLQVDMPISSLNLVKQTSLLTANSLQLYHFPEAGHRAIYDMVALANDNYLLALGEAGIIMVDKMGKQLAYFMIAADSLVLSKNRLQVLALIKRDNYYRVEKIDLTTQKSVDLGVIKFQLCQWQFDGINWTIINNNCVEVVNIAETLSVIWRVDLAPNRIQQIVTDDYGENYVTIDPENKIETFYYSLPKRNLINRSSIDIETGVHKIIMNAELGMLYFKYSKDQARLLCKRRNYQYYNEIPLTISPEQFNNLRIFSTGQMVVLFVVRMDGSGYDIYLYYLNDNSIKAVIDWASPHVISGRCIAGHYCFFDMKGRALHVNADENKITSFSI